MRRKRRILHLVMQSFDATLMILFSLTIRSHGGSSKSAELYLCCTTCVPIHVSPTLAHLQSSANALCAQSLAMSYPLLKTPHQYLANSFPPYQLVRNCKHSGVTVKVPKRCDTVKRALPAF